MGFLPTTYVRRSLVRSSDGLSAGEIPDTHFPPHDRWVSGTSLAPPFRRTIGGCLAPLVDFRGDLSGNSAGTDGGGLYSSGIAALIFCTVADNWASAGGSVYADASGEPVDLIGTQVSRKKADDIFGRVIRL